MGFPKILLISFGALVLIVIVLIWFYPVFHIIFSKWVFGKFSARYIETYKKYTGKSPYGYCIKDDLVNYLASFFQNKSNYSTYKSSKPTNFYNTPFGTKFEKVLSDNRKPFCVNSNRTEQFEFKVVGYRSEMFDIDMKSYFYFLNEKFFMGEYVFKNPSNEKLKELAVIIKKKYIPEQSLDSYDFLIMGINDSKLRFEHTGFNLSIKYMDFSNQDVIDQLENYWSLSVKTWVKQPESDFESELFHKL